jgi:hypothetical protein
MSQTFALLARSVLHNYWLGPHKRKYTSVARTYFVTDILDATKVAEFDA